MSNKPIPWYETRAAMSTIMIVMLIMLSAGMITCSIDVVETKNINDGIRKANNGVLPGQEVISNKGERTSMRTYKFKNYTVICLGSREGGCFVDPESIQ